MNYEKKILDKLDRLNGLMEEQKVDMKAADSDVMKNIRQMPDGPDKTKLNEMRNKLKSVGNGKGSATTVKGLISELKEISLNLSNAS